MSFSDVDWIGYHDTRQLFTNWFIFLGDAFISSKSKK